MVCLTNDALDIFILKENVLGEREGKDSIFPQVKGAWKLWALQLDSHTVSIWNLWIRPTDKGAQPHYIWAFALKTGAIFASLRRGLRTFLRSIFGNKSLQAVKASAKKHKHSFISLPRSSDGEGGKSTRLSLAIEAKRSFLAALFLLHKRKREKNKRPILFSTNTGKLELLGPKD